MVLTFVVVVRAEIRKVVQHQELMQARANARLGLEMAIAKLQETAGADTRVTAPAVSDPAARPNQFLLGRAIDSRPFIPGNSLQLNPRYAQSVGYFLSHDPNTAFSPRDFWPFQANGEVTPGNVLLVGPGSVAMTDSNSDGVPDGFVAAPLRPIQESVPRPEGQFAYWIRDDGMRAQINLMDPFRLETGRLDLREQAATAQRVGSELLLPGFDPDNDSHALHLGRTLTGSQLDLTPFVGVGGARELFHDITLQSLGLPVNVQTGGFRRDLTAVLREAEANGGQINRNGPQWQALLDFQEARLGTWRAQTVALESTSRPAGMDEHRWNALNAITLREEQSRATGRHANQRNDPSDAPELREKIFPPHSDLDIRWDPGGASWSQLLTFPTMTQRLQMQNGALRAGQASEREKNINPVIARFAMSYYFTLDWPTLRLHSIPLIVLWNPYSEPLSVPEGHHWQYKWEFQTNHFEGFGMRFAFRNPAWRSGEELWTPRYMFGVDTWGYGGGFRFRLLNEHGGTDVVIPPGEALFFTMHRHQRIETTVGESYSRDWQWTDKFVTRGTRIDHTETNIIDLRAGLHGFGGYSLFVEHNDLNNRMLNLIARGPRTHHNNTPRSDWWPGPGGFWNAWDEAGFPLAVSQYVDPDTGRTMDGLWAPFGPETHGSEYPVQFARNRVEGSLRNIAINEVGFNPARGWELTDARFEQNPTRSDLRSRGMYLRAVSNSAFQANPNHSSLDPSSDPWVSIPWLYMRIPAGFNDGFTPMGQPLSGFDPNRPFDDSFPQFPSWGTVWALRQPDPVIQQPANFGAPSRWLIDFNPTAPFQIADPVGRTRAETHRGAFMNPASYMGGFSLFPGAFSPAELTFNERNQAIGLSDDFATMRFPSLNSIPRLVLYDVPESSEDIVSIASFKHAAPHSVAHAWAWRVNRHNPNATPLQPRWFAAEHDTGEAPGTDYAPSSPVYAIGNSFASILVPRDRAQKTYFPGPLSPASSPESIPFAAGRWPNGNQYPLGNNSISFFPAYDVSYIYNQVLWDDFILTPDSNRRILWRGDVPQRDFNTSAENLLISGAFNVNSTSVSAWASLLAAMLDVEISNQTNEAVPDSPERIPFSRFLNPVSRNFSPAAGDDFEDASAYAGFRKLTLDEVEALAEAIVEQVKLRGPFLSLGEFVNRRLVPADRDQTHGLGLSGAIQTAIQNAGLNDAMGAASDDIWIRQAAFQGNWPPTSGQPQLNASAFTGMHLENVEGPRTAGSPGFLLQSDILARIGSVLTARSDTFTIRAYGDLNQGGTTQARAWVEATVRRMPEFVDAASPANPNGNSPPDATADLSLVNQMFGRRFEVISFRWLNEEDI